MDRAARSVLTIFCVIVFFCSALADDVGPARYDFRDILNNVAKDVSKNFYDPNLKGLDWKAATEEARRKIDSAKTVNEMELAIFQLLEKLDDSHTVFIPPASAVEAKYGFDAKAYGDEVRVFDVDRGGAADVAGLRVGDRILEINGYTADRTNADKLLIYTRKLYQVPSLDLLVQRPGGETQTVSIIPKLKKIPVVVNREANFNQVWALMLDDFAEWSKKYQTYHYGSQDGIAYVQLREFPNQGEDFLKGMAENTKGSKAVIIDLRDNPGGDVKTLLSFAGLFQTTPTDMATQVGRTKSEPMKVKPQKPYIGVPLVILVDSETASASEVLTRHLQKTRKAVVIGDHTAGAVIISKTIEGSVGAGMITEYATSVGIGRVVFPDGEELEKKGITPDVPCLPSQTDMKEGRDICLAKAFAVAKEAVKAAEPAKSSN